MKQFCLVALLTVMASGCDGGGVVVITSSPSAAATSEAAARSGSQTSSAQNSTNVTVRAGSTNVTVRDGSTSVTVRGGSSTAVSRSSVSVSAGSDCTIAGAISPGPSRVVSRSASGDTFSVTFDRGVPNFLAVSQPSPRFTSESGESVLLAGSAGLRITLSGLQSPGDPAGPGSLTPGGQELLELRKIGDAGGVVIWAIGLREPVCPTALATGSTLTFHFR